MTIERFHLSQCLTPKYKCLTYEIQIQNRCLNQTYTFLTPKVKGGGGGERKVKKMTYCKKEIGMGLCKQLLAVQEGLEDYGRSAVM